VTDVAIPSITMDAGAHNKVDVQFVNPSAAGVHTTFVITAFC
jgi:hypothetical protein